MNRPPLQLDRSPRFYSQHGEDIVAWKVLADSPGPRYFIEVGMIDGKRFSNTLAFEERGWRGLCVEAHPDYVPHVRANRPGSTVMHAAASDTSGVMPFHADPRGDLSSLQPRDAAQMKERFGKWFEGYEVVDVPVRTLDAMLEEAGAPGGIELISIDVEGGELGVLGGLDLDRWRPRMLIIEADDDAARTALDEHLLPAGYTRARSVGINVFYTRTLADAWRVRLARIDQRVFHTAHPADTRIDNQVVIPCTFETRSQYAKRLISTLARAA